MTARQPFQPAYGTGQNFTTGAASASITLPRGTKQVALTNTGANPGYVRITAAASAATTADYKVPAGAQVVVSKADDDVVLSHIQDAAGTTTMNVICGEGF